MKKEIKFTLKQLKDYTKGNLDNMNDIVFLKLLYDKDIKAIKYYLNELFSSTKDEIKAEFKHFELKGYIKVTYWEDPINNYQIRASLKNIFGNGEIEVENWIEQWRELFPKGTNRGGYRYRGDKQGCLTKMKRFIKKHPKIHKAQIFEATKRYVRKFSPTFNYMKQAHYFIEKDGSSTLLGEIEALNNKENVEEYVNSKSI